MNKVNKSRPNVANRDGVACKDHTEWMELYGFTTYVSELSVIFGINLGTLIQRVKSGWPIEAACVAEPNEKGTRWTIKNVDQLMEQEWVIPLFKATLQRYFHRKA